MNLPEAPAADPVFEEPWQAQAFALAVALSARGCFSWTEWSAALADEIRRSTASAAEADGARYYHHWLTALETIVIEKGLCDSSALQRRKHAWIEAYEHTPHGQPVEL